MKKILVPVTAHSGGQTENAVAEAIAISRQEEVEIHLLDVQIPVPGDVSAFFQKNELRAIHLESGMDELAPAIAQFKAAGVAHTVHVVVGRSAETIVRMARELDCDRIVMGKAAQPGFAEKLFGTVASQVRHLTGPAGGCRVIGS